MRAWNIAPEAPVPDGLLAAVGGNPFIASALVRRGICTAETAQRFLEPGSYQPSPAYQLPGMEQAVERLKRAICNREPICVWGDFDADGQTSTAILVSTLRDLGARVNYHIPVRADESHGISIPVLKRWLEDGYRLFLTCDTGISAFDAITYANQQGAEVLVTDHHILPEKLPPACAIVNPRFLPPEHPLSRLPGVGVAYKLSEALYERFQRSEAAEGNLDLVAIGIVADLAGLKGDTRYLLQRGLAALKSTRRLGLLEMIALAEISPERISEEHIGFGLAPRLNALGRLADANPAVELLTTTDLARARTLARDLEGLNTQRRYLTDQVFQAALEQIERDPVGLNRPSIILTNPNWPAGVIGIVASRLVERFHRPVILLACPPGEAARGSARSVAGCDITRAISTQADVLLGFGGHPMAAGLSIEAEHIPVFQRGLNQAIEEQLGRDWQEPALEIDAFIPLKKLDLNFVEEIERLAPFGSENPSLIWASKDLKIRSAKPVGRGGEHLVVALEDQDGLAYEVIWWQAAGSPIPEGWIDLSYSARTTDFRGQRGVSIEWIEARPAERESIRLTRAHPLEIYDYRGERAPKARLQEILARGDTQVWREGEACAELPGQTRLGLCHADTLVIWTPPPDIATLRLGMKLVHPGNVYLFNLPSGNMTTQALLIKVTQLIKYSLHHKAGCINICQVAASCGHRDATVAAAIEWLEASGTIQILSRSQADIQIQAGGIKNTGFRQDAEARLKALIEDTAAYRAYYAHTPADILLERDME